VENGVLPVGALSIVSIYSPRIFVVIISPRTEIRARTWPTHSLTKPGGWRPNRRCRVFIFMEIIDRHPGDTFLMLRASYVNICNGNLVAAALIHIFEQWHINKIKTREQDRRYRTSNALQTPRDTLMEGLYQWHTTADLERQLMGLGKRDKIQEARAQLVSMGIITEHRNPNPKFAFDKTTYFIFYPESVATYLDLRRQPAADISTASVPLSDRTTENSQREGENRNYTNITSIDHDKDHHKDIPAADAPGDKKQATKPDKKRKKSPGAEIDTDWQRWVDRYEDHVKARNDGAGHRWDGAQLGPQGLKGVRLHLVKISTKLDGKTDDDCGFGAWCFILDHWDALGDDWLRGQFDLTVILKKITDILNRLRNATNTNRGAHPSGNGKLSPGAARFEAIKNY
jgi:hypothetical protein